MRGRQFLVTIAFLVAVSTFAEDDVSIVEFRFVDASLSVVLKDYSNKSGKRVEIVGGVHATFTMESTNGMALAEYLQLVETQLKEANIGLFPISTNRFIATWLEPPAAVESAPRSELRTRRGSNTGLSREELNERLEQFNSELIRRGSPILTGESDKSKTSLGTSNKPDAGDGK